jgi:hypothetical protein
MIGLFALGEYAMQFRSIYAQVRGPSGNWLNAGASPSCSWRWPVGS